MDKYVINFQISQFFLQFGEIHFQFGQIQFNYVDPSRRVDYTRSMEAEKGFGRRGESQRISWIPKPGQGWRYQNENLDRVSGIKMKTWTDLVV